MYSATATAVAACGAI